MNGLDTGLLSIEQATGLYFSKNNEKTAKTENKSGVSFEQILAQQANLSKNVKFSKHAAERLNSRQIELSDGQLDRLNEGVNRAKTKHINESLVMMDNLAFIVNVKNNTVVTALESDEDSVFTNIDGAVIV